jgi:hypothetical protein
MFKVLTISVVANGKKKKGTSGHIEIGGCYSIESD